MKEPIGGDKQLAGKWFCESDCCFYHMLIMGDLEQAIFPVSSPVKLCYNDNGNHGECLTSAHCVLG